MENSGSNFITRLQEIRNTLLDATHTNRGLAVKLVGPRPAGDSPKQIGKSPDSVDVLILEISSLSNELVKLANGHHSVLGSFQPAQSDCGTDARLA